jgi:chromosome segregation ATPase
MATRTAKLNLEVGGEQKYKQEIADINRGHQVLNAEMKKLAEQYRGNENSMEAMRARSDLLQRQLQQQQDKVRTLREALQNAATQYGEADRRTQSWQT